ncbi:hypothetical protein [Mycolicibacterium fortuitum]|uniref:hypothetical protein n=1 Tax=Mycolicibacterium fortuitum TaxID=1766 RepID=UPI0026257E90|nr:hypothetical protein [Mycolicibacterium fortuitum]
MTNSPMDEAYQLGAQWSSKDGERKVVIVAGQRGSRGTEFVIRNLKTGRESRIELAGLVKKFRYTGLDQASTGGP